MRFGCLLAVVLTASTAFANDYRVLERQPAERLHVRAGRAAPTVLARRNGITVTRMTPEQIASTEHLVRPRGDGGVADIRDLLVIQFLYLDSTCEDLDAQSIREICEGPCNAVGLRWFEDIAHDGATIYLDGEEYAEIDGVPEPPEGGAENGFNIFGIEAGEHTFRVEELETGTFGEVVFNVLDEQPFGDVAHVSCQQLPIDTEIEPPDEVGALCRAVVRWGNTNVPRGTEFSIFVEGLNGIPGHLGSVPGTSPGGIVADLEPGTYCFSARAEYSPDDDEDGMPDEDKAYIGCLLEASCCEITCEEITCPPVAYLDVCQSEYGATGSVRSDWANPNPSPYVDINYLVNGTAALTVGATREWVEVGPFGPGEYAIGIQGDCGGGDLAAPEEVSIEILPETPYTDPIVGDIVCSFDPEADDPNNPGEVVPTMTAAWTNGTPAAFIDVFVRLAAEPENLYFVGTLGGGGEDVSVWPMGPEDRIVVQFFRYFDTGCYGSERIDCVDESDAKYFIRGVCSNIGTTPQITDAVRLLTWRFAGGDPGPCHIACDATGDGRIEIDDALRILLFLFQGGVAPFGWVDNAIPVCERYEEGIPGFDIGCEESHEDCSEEGPVE